MSIYLSLIFRKRCYIPSNIKNSLVMEGTPIVCGRRITDSLIGRHVKILGCEQNIPKDHRLILGDMATVTL